MFILSRSRVISQKIPFLSPVASNVQKRWFLAYNSWSTQDKHTKVYIFEFSVKFRVDWYATWGVLKEVEFFRFQQDASTQMAHAHLCASSPRWRLAFFHQIRPFNKNWRGSRCDLTKMAIMFPPYCHGFLVNSVLAISPCDEYFTTDQLLFWWGALRIQEIQKKNYQPADIVTRGNNLLLSAQRHYHSECYQTTIQATRGKVLPDQFSSKDRTDSLALWPGRFLFVS